ncbi:T9SS type A sorting domain-containing protein, partial [bacterium]|nr:T9SS type A sorting domain-containing protein [bacterium]
SSLSSTTRRFSRRPTACSSIRTRPGDRLWYQLVATDHLGGQDVVEPGTILVSLGEAPGVSFAPAFPNPARSTATLEFTVPYDGAHAALRMYDAAGRLVAQLCDETVGAGRHARTWNGRSDAGSPAASGQYFCVLTVDGEQRMQKLMLIR